MPALVTLPYHYPSRLLAYLALMLSCLLFSSASQAQDIFDTPKQSGLDTSILAPDDEFLLVTEAFQLEARLEGNQLILEWRIAPAYYLYEERFKLNASNGLTLTPQFNEGITKYDEFFAKDMTVFYDKAVLTVDLPADTAPFNLQVESQGCADAGLCYPPYTDYLQVDPDNNQVVILPPPADPLAEAPPATTPVAEAPSSLAKIVLFAILGGIILNLMPCVFPVLSIKVMSLAQADRERLPMHGWVYTAGIVLCFVGFAGALLLARAGGEAIGWGFQLQSPLLIAALTYLFFVMGLSMSGMINIGTRWMGAGQSLTQKSGLSGSFFTGVLAAVVASPCTAPFMGAALGFALTQPAIVCLAIFAALGLGMALPLLLLCYLPALANRLPKPGVWMENLKEFLAFPLYLTAVWLLWVLGRQAGIDASMIVAAGAVAIAFGCWLLNRSASGAWQWVRRSLIAAAWVGALVLPWQMIGQPTESSRWQAYSPERLQQLRASGAPVFINLTADWCLTCLANERLTLHTEEVEQAFDDYQVVTLKGDWTNRDPQITALLAEYGRSGVPLYLWFPANGEGKAEILPQLLTPGRLIESISGQKTAFNN
ncbi:MAG TPA: protein-disulfide reductase DsbD [Cellvibrio sp.]|nr:protein-disulfide reductase DsbD [Cellvibrio sp.]